MSCEKDDNIKCKTEAKKLYKIFGQAFLIPCGKCGEYTNENPCYSCLEKRIQELEDVIEKIRLISRRSYYRPVTSVAAMKNLKIINQRAEQALKGGD